MAVLCAALPILMGQLVPAQVPSEWQTLAEKTGFAKTGRYDEAVAFCRKLDAASNDAEVRVFGQSPQGRDMVALVLSRDPAFRSGRGSTRPVVMVQNGIHSGEIEGKDASMMLAREMVVPANKLGGTGSAPRLGSILDKVSIVIVPVFSCDAHERYSKYNRPNQNGPEEMGWRATAQNFNLNRDYVKADAGEMQNLLELIGTVNPDFFIDNHTTDGGDWQYVVQYDVPYGPAMDQGVSDISRKFVTDVMPLVDADGYLTAPYFGGFSYRAPQRGISLSAFGPRYSTGYMAARNRPSLLVETHVLKDYRTRVYGTYSLNLRTFEWCGKAGSRLMRACQDADSACRDLKEGDEIVLTSRTAPTSRPFLFKGLRYEPYKSDVSGGEIDHWTTEKVDIPTTIRDEFLPGLTVKLPHAYLVPRQWAEALTRSVWHGFEYRQVKRATTLKTDVTVFVGPKLATSTFEGRVQPTFTTRTESREVPIHPGDVVIPVGQPLGRLAAQVFEPSAPDSFVKWGLFNIVFEGKEYAEDYAIEPWAKKALETDAALKAEFEARLKDETFAKSPAARLAFFYERSPYYDSRLNVYPVLSLTKAQADSILK